MWQQFFSAIKTVIKAEVNKITNLRILEIAAEIEMKKVTKTTFYTASTKKNCFTKILNREKEEKKIQNIYFLIFYNPKKIEKQNKTKRGEQNDYLHKKLF